MSVIGVEEIYKGRKGGINEKGQRSYTRMFLVEVNNLLDDATVVLATSGLPHLYFPYATQEGIVDIGATCRGRNAVQHDDMPFLWDVTLDYSSAPMDSQSDPSSQNNFQQQPDLRPPTFTWSSNKSERLFPKDWTAYNNPSDPMALPLPLVNSAGCPLGVTIPASNPVMKITCYRSKFNFPTIPQYQDAVNNATWQGFPAHTVRCTDYGAASKFDNNVFYFQLDVQVEFKWDGWNPLYILDAGTYEIITVMGKQTYKAITDAFGQPVHQPVPLDGMGHALAAGGTPVYLSFQGLREEDFSMLITGIK